MIGVTFGRHPGVDQTVRQFKQLLNWEYLRKPQIFAMFHNDFMNVILIHLA